LVRDVFVLNLVFLSRIFAQGIGVMKDYKQLLLKKYLDQLMKIVDWKEYSPGYWDDQEGWERNEEREKVIKLLWSLIQDTQFAERDKILEKIKIDRNEIIQVLRNVCKDFGDNDWSDELHPADVIEKHLARYWYENFNNFEEVLDQTKKNYLPDGSDGEYNPNDQPPVKASVRGKAGSKTLEIVEQK
jgi:hypothetical protein